MNFKSILLIGVAGSIGTIGRYLFTVFFNNQFSMPGLATFLVNILGSLAIGIVYGWGLERLNPETLTILTVGVLGGFTTFSAFSMETVTFIHEGKWIHAAAYVLLMVILGVLATFLGFKLSH